MEVFSGADKLTADELIAYVSQFDAVMTGLPSITREMMAAGNRLKVVARYGVGVDSVDIEAATELGVVVTNIPGANTVAVAELTIGLMFCLARQLPQHHAWTKAGRWKRRVGLELYGKTLGLMGLGQIGKEVARRAVHLGMKVVAFDPYWDERFAQELGVERLTKEQVLQEADMVSLHMPLNPETIGAIGQEELTMMKPGAMLINTARGGLIDEEALYMTLASGHLGGAALDVFSREPPTGGPLFELDNIVLSPHRGFQTVEASQTMSRVIVENVTAVLRGERPPNIVNPEVLSRLRPL